MCLAALEQYCGYFWKQADHYEFHIIKAMVALILGCLDSESSQIIQILWNELAEQLLLKKIQLAEEKSPGEFNLVLYNPGLNNLHQVYRCK